MHLWSVACQPEESDLIRAFWTRGIRSIGASVELL